MRIFLFLFILFPVAELALLIRVGGAIGVLGTLLLLALGAVVGVLIMRLAGFATALRARERLARGEAPEREMLDGLMMVVAGGLFLLPGFISDVLALLLLFPPSRKLLFGLVQRRIQASVERQQRAFHEQARQYQQSHPGSHSGAGEPGARRPDVIEGEWERRDK